MKKTIRTIMLTATIAASVIALPTQAAVQSLTNVTKLVKQVRTNTDIIKTQVSEVALTANAQIAETIDVRQILEPQTMPKGLSEFVAGRARSLEIALALIPHEEIGAFLGTPILTINDASSGSVSLEPASSDLDGCQSGTDCALFKEELRETMKDLETTLMLLVDDVTTEGEVLNENPSLPMDLSMLRELITKVPGIALFPIFKATSTRNSSTASTTNHGGVSCVIMGSGICDLRQLISLVRSGAEERREARKDRRDTRREERQIEDGTTMQEYPFEYYKKINCENTLTRHPLAWINSLSAAGYYATAGGKMLMAAGNTHLKNVDPPVDGGGSLGPHVTGNISSNYTKTLGEVYSGIGGIILGIADSKRNKLRHCVELRAQLNIWDKLNKN